MTTPDDPRSPSGGEPGGWEQQPGTGQPQYGQPQYGQPPYGQPQYGQPEYQQYPPPNQPQFGPPPGYAPPSPQVPPPPWAGQVDEPLMQQSRPHGTSGRGKAVAIGAAVVVVLGGGIATYAAVSSSSGAGGSSSPQAAVQKVFTDMGNSDLLGLLDDLPPGERDAVATPFKDSVSQLERIGVIRPGADLNHLSGVTIAPHNITYGSSTKINNHVQVVRVTGGTLTVDADATKLPLAGDLLNLIKAKATGPTSVHHTVNIAQKIRQTGTPLKIAAEEVGGRWYPSILYSIAASALGTPTAGDAIPAHGASSADDAARQMIQALLGDNAEQVIALTSPDEDAVLHDYGTKLAQKMHYPPAPVRLTKLTFHDSSVSGGTRVSLASLALSVQGHPISLTVGNDGCIEVRAQGQDQRLCRSRIAQIIEAAPMPTAVRGTVSDLFKSVTKIGIDTSESNGQWYVDPLRTWFDLFPTVLSNMTSQDVHNLLQLAAH